MVVKRIVPDISYADPSALKDFYCDVLGLEIVMDQGWIITFASSATSQPQISVMSQGGAGAIVPDFSIEVDDVDAAYKKAKAAKCEITYEIRNEDWGVRRFFVIDPAGKVLNVLSHIA